MEPKIIERIASELAGRYCGTLILNSIFARKQFGNQLNFWAGQWGGEEVDL